MATETDNGTNILARGVVEIIDRLHFERHIASGRTLRVKLGIDPTSPALHLGRLVPILKLRDFQKLGHQAILIIGSATGVVGDTSDKDAERPMLSRETIEENEKTYLKQLGKVLNMNKTEVLHNSEWLDKLTYREIGEHADVFSVADFIARENIKSRLDAGKRVSLREVLYPLMQGYDSVATHCDVELGGTDQRFNLLAGRRLQEHFGMEPQDVLMMPLIAGTDGRKMSSSWGNTVNLTDTPHDIFGKIMRITDETIIPYATLLTRIPEREIETFRAAVDAGGTNARDAKLRLAREVVTMIYDEQQANGAQRNFMETFSEQKVPLTIPESRVEKGTYVRDAAVSAGDVPSNTEYARLMNDGAVSDAETGAAIETLDERINATRSFKFGKRRFRRFIVD